MTNNFFGPSISCNHLKKLICVLGECVKQFMGILAYDFFWGSVTQTNCHTYTFFQSRKNSFVTVLQAKGIAQYT